MEPFNSPTKDHMQRLLANDQVIIYVAIDNNEVVGGLTAYVLPSVYHFASVYLYDIAIAATHQRRGIGRRLLEMLKEFCAAQGYDELFVQADIADQHALDFYHATGGKRTDVVHFTYTLNNR